MLSRLIYSPVGGTFNKWPNKGDNLFHVEYELFLLEMEIRNYSPYNTNKVWFLWKWQLGLSMLCRFQSPFLNTTWLYRNFKQLKMPMQGLPWQPSGQDFPFQSWGVCVQFLVGELRSHVLHGQKKQNIKQKQYCNKFKREMNFFKCLSNWQV